MYLRAYVMSLPRAEPSDLAETPPAEPVDWLAIGPNGPVTDLIKAKTWFEARAIARAIVKSTDMTVELKKESRK